MKFTSSIAAKKQHPLITSVEDVNTINLIKSSKNKVSSTLLQIPKSLQTATATDIVCAQEGETADIVGDNTTERTCYDLDELESVTDESECSELERRRHSSQTDSVYDDSGFNSSASNSGDDRDDYANIVWTLNETFAASDSIDADTEDCDSLDTQIPSDSNNNSSISECNSLNPVTQVCQSLKDSSEESLDMISSVDVSENILQSSLVVKKSSSISKKLVNSSSSESVKTPVRRRSSSRRRVSSTETSLASSTNTTSSTVLPSTASDRSSRPRTMRRRRVRDCNNNDAEGNLSSYYRNPPFQLAHCVRERGLLSLAVCIIYTLALFFICGAMGMVVSCIKSAVGKEDLKEMKANILQSRRRRTAVASG